MKANEAQNLWVYADLDNMKKENESLLSKISEQERKISMLEERKNRTLPYVYFQESKNLDSLAAIQHNCFCSICGPWVNKQDAN